jgi:hypothetical protein
MRPFTSAHQNASLCSGYQKRNGHIVPAVERSFRRARVANSRVGARGYGGSPGGTSTLALDARPLRNVARWACRYEPYWTERLDRLEAFFEEKRKRT